MTTIIPHLPEAPNIEEKYSYVLKYPIFLKILYLISACSWLAVGYGYFQFFQINWIYYVLIAPIVVFIIAFNLLSMIINSFYKKLDIQKHEKFVSDFWKKNDQKFKINVFLPVCGEDIFILRNTWEGVKLLNSKKYIVEPIVLDDQDNPNVKLLAKEFGFKYIVRENRGYMKKAGNLKNAFDQTTGDFIVILDADFKPRYDFILDSLPYMSDPKVGIIQTPQFFDHHDDLHSRSSLQSGAGNIQEYFYKIIQNSKNTFGGAICVGSCAMYRRDALEEVGGTAQVEHSEDVITGFLLICKGWKIQYLPLALSKGVCPDDLHAFFKQQTRWCSGSMSMMLNKDFWFSSIPVMTKLCYISGFMFYISNPLSLILTIQSFLLLWFYTQNLGLLNLIIFVPLIICSSILQYFYIYPKVKTGTILAHASTVWFYSFTLISLFFGHVEGWKPTGIKSSLSKGFLGISRFVTVYLFLYLLLVLGLLFFNRIDVTNYLLFPSLFWLFINLFYHLYFWFSIQDYIKVNHKSRFGYLGARKLLWKIIITSLLLLISALLINQIFTYIPNYLL